MRRPALVLLLTLAAALLPAGIADAKLGTTRTAFVDASGRSVDLRGFNVMPVWDDHPGRTWGPARLQHLREQGFNTVRYVLFWSHMQPRRGQLDPQHLATLDRAIGYAREAGLHVVLAPIHIYQHKRYVPKWAWTGDVVRSIHRNARQYVRALAERYADDPAVVAHDLVNEPPTWPLDHPRILRMYDALMRTVRQVDRQTILMFEPAYGDVAMTGADDDIRRLKRHGRVAFTLHDYYAGGRGHGYMPRGEQDTRANYAWRGDGYNPAHRDDLEDHLLVNLRIMRRLGIPVWIGEFGMDPGTPGMNAWIRDKTALFRKYGLGWAWWLYGANLLDARDRLLPFTALLR